MVAFSLRERSPFSHIETVRALLRAIESAKLRFNFFSLTEKEGVRGIEGEELGIYVMVIGNPYAPHTIWITTAAHGPEGYPASLFLPRLIEARGVVERFLGKSIRIVIAADQNCYGKSFGSRFDHLGVDPNRNYRRSFPKKVLPLPRPYRDISTFLNPTSLSFVGEKYRLLRLRLYRWKHGDEVIKRIVSLGQRSDPKKLLFVGFGPCWTRLTMEHIIRLYSLPTPGHDVHMDIHSALGPRLRLPQTPPLLVTIYKEGGPEFSRARKFFGQSAGSATGNGYTLSNLGTIEKAFLWNLPKERTYTGVTAELGTEPIENVVMAVRSYHAVLMHGDPTTGLGMKMRDRVCATFCPLDKVWQEDAVDAQWQLLTSTIDNLKKEIAP